MADHEATGWVGWVAFASLMLIVGGVLQFIYGLGALFHQTWYVTTSSGAYVLNLSTWGWVYLVLGILLFVTGILLFEGNLVGRAIGAFLVLLGILANLALLAVTPVWSTLVIAVYLLVGYAILAHGGEMKQLAG